MSGNLIYDLFSPRRSFALPTISIAFPHIKKAYFAKMVQHSSIQTAPYTVASGDTLGEIARAHNTTVQAIQEENNIANINRISVGQILLVPTEDVTRGRVTFERINGARMGEEVFIVVETENFRSRTIKMNIRQGQEEVIAGIDSEIEVEFDGQHTILVETEVGAFSSSGDFENSEELQDLAVAKVKIEPATNEAKGEWSCAISESEDEFSRLYLLVDAHSDNSDIPVEAFNYYGQNEGTDSKKNLWLDMDGLWFQLSTGRAPWMESVLSESQEMAGIKENRSPLKERIKDSYHNYTSPGSSYGHTTAWCAAFCSWALNEAGFANPESGRSRMFIDTDEKTLKQVDKPYYGAIATWSDCSKSGRVKGTGHVSFVFGKYSDSETTDKYLVLGGNQGDSLKVTKYDCSGNVFKSYRKKNKENVVRADGTTEEVITYTQVYKKFRGFFMPKSYEPTASDELKDSDTYASQALANVAATTEAIETSSGESSR